MEVSCPSCQALLALAESASGKRALCPNCSAEFRVPDLQRSEGGTADMSTVSDGTLPVGTSVANGSLIRCPACDRTLATDPSMAGKPIICPTCKRRMRVPAAYDSSGPVANDLGYSPEISPGRWPKSADNRTLNPPPEYPTGFDPYVTTQLGTDPYAPIPTLPGSVPGMQTATNYALPGAFLTLLSAVGILIFGLWLIAAIVGVWGQKAPMDLDEFAITVVFSLTSIAVQLLTFIGGIQMIRRRQLRWARLGAFAALYPCGPCMIVQLPVAIWAIVILNREIAVYDFASPIDYLETQPRR